MARASTEARKPAKLSRNQAAIAGVGTARAAPMENEMNGEAAMPCRDCTDPTACDSVCQAFAREQMPHGVEGRERAEPVRMRFGKRDDAADQAQRADGVAPSQAPEQPLPYWEPCNPGCDPEFNGQRDRHCAKLCKNARDALGVQGRAPEGSNDGR